MISWLKIRRLKIKYFPLCENCGLDKCLNVHHIIPKSLEGKNYWGNLQTLCFDCHKIIHKYLSRMGSSRLLKQKLEKRKINPINQYWIILKRLKRLE